jgi:hypothetical protein
LQRFAELMPRLVFVSEEIEITSHENALVKNLMFVMVGSIDHEFNG